MMVMAARALEVSGMKLQNAGESYLSVYKDAGLISNNARALLAKLARAGFIEAEDGRLRPADMATRADAALLLQKVLKI
jgi:hypothetical protein